ncbi:ATP-dependent helicase [Saccharophagus sp. K07]|uniref:DEAD/DEAH box helicase n=1 Tax=Saccharophagus sp. K07 TaxID=2283636 RepID=UPI0016528852|nr:DEAD/DEAH box helicase [Saccharophagus sp. K07]MBC6904322.1 ATP-dependent helicase [Saccharophagus sp. K07]
MTQISPTFEQLGLSQPLLQALQQIGYESPSPIQAMAMPPLLKGRDVLGQAQTGTGKTAAFALPVLQQLDLKQKHTQALVLAPTRELAIQVAEAFQSYAHFLPGFHILPIYGGQAYDKQIQALKRGVQVVVGTPGRVMDHMRKGTLKLDKIKHFVLDEADEMLRMGFIDDVEWILSHAPSDRQIALFSATMPREIAKVANTYLNNPEHVKIEVKTTTAETIRQRYWPVSGLHKLDAITRILEVEPFDAMIIFVRTKTTTVELAEKLEARGYSAAALNGDIPQNVRERTIDKLKNGQIDILVATDVAARGLDVDRISHVLNYDIPYDTEAYVHRIGRTGRAGRAGEAILFVAKREVRMLHAIEKATGQAIQPMRLPSAADINEHRVIRFKQKIQDALQQEDLDFYRNLIEDICRDNEQNPIDIAAALACLYQGDQPLLLKERDTTPSNDFVSQGRKEKHERSDRPDKKEKRKKQKELDVNMETYRVEVGRRDGVRPGDLVGAIANEAGIDSEYIGHIKIHDDHCTVDLPKGMPKEIFRVLQKAWVCQKQLNISLASEQKYGKSADNSAEDNGRGRRAKPDHKGSRDKKFERGSRKK